MHLKRLEAFGFKSFADRMVFDFGRGVTGVVGPNGCGKSNVVDAIKWALGEQRPTSVRGTEMGDVLFSGSGGRKPLGLAEVSLTFANESRFLPMEADEVVLTRRLYRDGTSEYLLNREPSRLRDIRELFMDTGGGRGALSILEQGKMDAVLQENPVERRMIFEEAAGIARYRLRQKETMRRIEHLDENLIRIRDILAEKDRQLRSMRAQAGRAERYRALEGEIRERRIALGLHRYALLLAAREEATSRVAELAAREAEVNGRLADLSGDLQGREARVEAARARAAALEAEAGKSEGAAEAAEERASSAAKLAGELEGRIAWYEGEIQVTLRRLEEAREQARASLAAEAEAEGGVAAREADLAAAEESIADALEGARALAEQARALRARGLEVLERKGRAASGRARLAAGEEALRARSTRLGLRLETVAREADRLRGEADASAAAAAAAVAEAGAARSSLAAEEGLLGGLESRIDDLRTRLSALDRAVHAARSRLDVLTALRDRHEGVGLGARRILEEAAKAGGLQGVRGVLAELLEAEPADAEAVELALGPFAESIVVESFDHARAAITLLKEEGIGRALFLPLDALRARAAGLPAGPAASRPAADAVRCADDLRAAVEAVLRGTILVEDLDAARAAAADPSAPFRVVTAGGEILGLEGGISGGRGDGAGHGMVARNAEIRTLRARLTQEEKRLAALQGDLRRAEGEAEEARGRVADARVALRRTEEIAAVTAATAGRVAAARARADEEAALLRGEEAEIADGLDAAAREAAILDGEEAAVAAEEASLEALRAAAAEEEANSENARRTAEARRNEARVEVARARERREAASERRTAAERALVEGNRSLDLARVEMENCRGRREDSLRTSSTARAEAEIARGRREKAVRDLVKAREESSGAAAELEEARRGVAALDGEFREYRAALEAFRLKESESRMRIEGLVDRMREEVRVDLPALHSEKITAPPTEAGEETGAASTTDGEGAADAALPRSEGMEGATPEATAEATAPVAFDPEAAEAAISELRIKMERMGNVNLEALDQVGSVEQETGALRTQEQDLVKGREELLEAVKLLNKQSRERFMETFEAIRGHFNETFRRLFGGGRADVFLAEGEDILEAGVEVVARPPGKELRSISLLSGGERAMTAVALLFAIFQARPSPFCVLDEVDAPLDETNVGRFTAMLREFLDRSQFIIITHNKRTMTMCDRLYGISMAEPGVSSRVLLELEKVAEREEPEAAVA
jgi:chromosome segregation protein